MVLCTLGDVVLDVVVRLDRRLVAGDDVVARTTLGAGGQAANVAAWAVALGARARYVGRRGNDVSGQLVEAELAERGVELAGPVGGRTGVVVSLIGADHDRSMASDRGSATELAPADLNAAWFQDCDWLHLSGYMLAGQPGADAAVEAARLARAGGARVSLDLSSSTLIDTVGSARYRGRVETLEPDVLFATEAEARALAGHHAPVTVIKQGAAGCTVVQDGTRDHHPAVPANPVDATGAGDAFAAGYLVGGPRLALEGGARSVSKSGAMP
jgi:sugar/nucleoside kinase (ribokinase family)